MKELAKILAYFLGVILIGATLAPPLFWAGKALASHGVLPFLKDVEFQKFFNRAMLVAAIALLWPVARWLQIGKWRELGLEPDPLWRRHALVAFLIAGGFVALMAAGYVHFEVYHWKKKLPWDRLPTLLLSAVVVGMLEEALFRGAILGLFRRSMKPMAALFWTTFIFTSVHFLKPDDDLTVSQVGWTSGFELLPHVFHPFTEPMTLLASFTTIFVLGWILGVSTLQTRALWAAIGFHAGVVFVKMSFSKFTKREEAFLPWIGEELQIGLVPVVVLGLAGVVLWFWLRRETKHPG